MQAALPALSLLLELFGFRLSEAGTMRLCIRRPTD
jgi:hypothetical protein